MRFKGLTKTFQSSHALQRHEISLQRQPRFTRHSERQGGYQVNPAVNNHPAAPEAAWERIKAVHPAEYARTRNAIEGAVSHLSPYITHGFVSLREVYEGVAQSHNLKQQDKFVFELGWRAYFRHVWQHRGDAIFTSLHSGPLPDHHYSRSVPDDIRQAQTGVNAIDMAIRGLYDSGSMHNHARMWLASYMVHLRKIHWCAGADWLYGHLLDGDLASNHLSWQWVAGTSSTKPYLFNAENVARYAPVPWHSPGSVIDTSYETLAQIAHQPPDQWLAPKPCQASHPAANEPAMFSAPPSPWRHCAPDAAMVEARDVWLVHPWSLGPLPTDLSEETLVIGISVADFHEKWPWSEKRWHFVEQRMADLTALRWHGEANALKTALEKARSVRCNDEPHLAHWLRQWAACETPHSLFAPVDPICNSFSQWWKQASPKWPAAST
jgi:deoxyribodipyrimidine photo-lyase